MQENLPMLAVNFLHDSVSSMSMLFDEILVREFDLDSEQKEGMIRSRKFHTSEALRRLNIIRMSLQLSEKNASLLEEFRCNLSSFDLQLEAVLKESPLSVEIGTTFAAQKMELSGMLNALKDSLLAVQECTGDRFNGQDQSITNADIRQQGGNHVTQ